MEKKHERPDDIRLYLSPIHRLINTFTPPELKRVFNVDSSVPMFVFGNGDISQDHISTTEEFLNHIENNFDGTHLLRINEYDFKKITETAIDYGMSVSNGQATLNTHDKTVSFTIQSDLSSLGEQLTQDKKASIKL